MSENVFIRRCSPRDHGAMVLLQASHGVIGHAGPGDPGLTSAVDRLCMPGIHFFVAERGGRSLGCIALAERPDYGEVKSHFVDPDGRGLGIGDLLLEHVIEVAKERGLERIKLETCDGLDHAMRLYLRHGFTDCERFGEYPDSPHSTFLEKAL